MEENLVEIVKLPSDEWRAYKKLRLEALQDSPQAFGTSYASSLERTDGHWRQRLEEAAQGQGNWLLFAKENQKLVGMIGAFIEEDDPQTASIISVYVSPESRGRGISKRLMTAILTEVQNAGIKRAILGVNIKQLPALNLYKSFGFQVVEKIEHLLMGNGEYHDEYLMEKILSE